MSKNESQSDTINGTTTNFTFDGNGNQTGSTGGPAFTYNGKEQTTAIGSNTYKYSGPDQQDRVQINSLTLDYSGLGLSRQKDSSGTTHFTRCSCGLLNNERLPGDHTYYYLLDGLGSVVGVTDSSGNKVNSYDYDPFGVMLNQQEGVSNPFKFAGGYLDASGYGQFGVRYYSPSLGRWTQQDPVAGSLFDLNSGNRYTYASDDPVNVVDPSGKDAITCIGAAFVGLITFDQIGGATLDLFFGIALALLAGGPLAIFFGGLVLAGAFFAVLGEFIVIYNTIIAPICGLPSISLG